MKNITTDYLKLSYNIHAMMPMLLAFCLLNVSLNDIASGADKTELELQRYRTVLQSKNMNDSADAIKEYLEGLTPNSETEKKIQLLITQMGAEDFFQREEAMLKLLAAPSVPMLMINEAAEGTDLEVRWRARHIRELRSRSTKEILYAIFQIIRLRQDKQLATAVLSSFPYCQQQYLKQAASAALVGTVSKSDLELLQKTIQKEDAELDQKLASIQALESLQKADADRDLIAITQHTNESIRLGGAIALLNHGNSTGLPVLAELLNSDNLKVRLRASQVLRMSTGVRFKYLAYAEKPQRNVKTANWKSWVKNNSNKAKLIFPLTTQFGKVTFNKTLVCFYSRNKVVEYDSSGKKVWEQAVKQPWGCQGLQNGHRIVLSRQDKTLYEYDASGKLTWSMTGLPGYPSSCERLENGNTLIACYTTNKVIEISPGKKIIWEATLNNRPSSRPVDAKRLDDGRTLVTLSGARKVVEIDQQGKQVWEISNLNNPYSARRLPSGNTLVTTSSNGTVTEFDHSGKAIWKKTGMRYPYDAQRLENGNTLVAHSQGVSEFDSSGKVVWQTTGNANGPAMRISRY